jgi:hypothetical protein
MRKSRNTIAATLAALCVAAVLFAGCGSGSNHAASWTKADISELEGELAQSSSLPAQLNHCVARYIEQHVDPSEARKLGHSDGVALGNAAGKACTANATSSSYDHTGEWTDASKQELDNALTALFVTNTSCYEPFIERKIAPYAGKSQMDSAVRTVLAEAASACKSGEERENNESLEEQYKIEHGETTGTAGETTSSVGETPGASTEVE